MITPDEMFVPMFMACAVLTLQCRRLSQIDFSQRLPESS
jgi:hypothetical protein